MSGVQFVQRQQYACHHGEHAAEHAGTDTQEHGGVVEFCHEIDGGGGQQYAGCDRPDAAGQCARDVLP